MQDVFELRDKLIEEYGVFSRSFTRIAAADIREEVDRQYNAGRYWPEPLIQINPNYQRKETVQELAAQGLLHPACADLFQTGKTEGHPGPMHLYTHQIEAIAKAREGKSYVVTTGTGSGKSLAFFVPIIDRILKAPESVMGDGYPSETFRVLKNNEEKEFGEYRTRRLVLEAWDRLDAVDAVG